MTVAASVEGYFEIAEPDTALPQLYALAKTCDENVGAEEPQGGYTPAAAAAAILNGADLDQLTEFFRIVLREGKGGWSFQPEGGW